jgi:CRP-like cAMP-binding protein
MRDMAQPAGQSLPFWRCQNWPRQRDSLCAQAAGEARQSSTALKLLPYGKPLQPLFKSRDKAITIMSERSFYALEYRELNALRWQSGEEGAASCFKITENGLIPVSENEDYDLAIGRSAIYLYTPASPSRRLRRKSPDAPSAGEARQGKFDNEVFHLLFQIEEFEPLNDMELWELSEKAMRLSYPADAVIVRQHDSGDSLFVIVEGELRVCLHTDDGQAIEVRRLAPGNCFGEMSLLTGAPRSANVEAETDCVVYEIRKEHLLAIMEKNDKIVQVLSELMAERQLASQQQAFFQAFAAADNQSVARSFSKKMRDFFGMGGSRESAA